MTSPIPPRYYRCDDEGGWASWTPLADPPDLTGFTELIPFEPIRGSQVGDVMMTETIPGGLHTRHFRRTGAAA